MVDRRHRPGARAGDPAGLHGASTRSRTWPPSMILGASLLVSSAIQPLFGLLADRRATPVFLWGGVAVGRRRAGAAGPGRRLPGVLACVVGSGLGIAAFHPEAARVANRISGDRPPRGWPGSCSAATPGSPLGPLLAALAIPFLDERATLVFLVPGAVVSLWLFHVRQRPPGRRVRRPRPPSSGRANEPTCPSVACSGRHQHAHLDAVRPARPGPPAAGRRRGVSDSRPASRWSPSRAPGRPAPWPARRSPTGSAGGSMLMWTMPVGGAGSSPAFLLIDGSVSDRALVVAGFVTMASFSVTVAMGQEYLPGRLALAAGLLIGFGAIGSAPTGPGHLRRDRRRRRRARRPSGGWPRCRWSARRSSRPSSRRRGAARAGRAA